MSAWKLNYKNSYIWICSNCKNVLPRGRLQKYCDNCGEKLVEKDEVHTYTYIDEIIEEIKG